MKNTIETVPAVEEALVIKDPFWKRAFDCIFAGLLLTFLAPVIILVTLLVRLKLGSPVFFQQVRPGRGEQLFTLFKFRTMDSKTGPDGQLAPDAERLTHFGKTLRALSLDELPQLINVLRGEMSIIGPRPLLCEYLPFYTPRERTRFQVRPGVTGLAQVRGRNSLSWDERFEADAIYVSRLSLSLDLWILWQTVKVVLRRKGVSVDSSQAEGNFAKIRGGTDLAAKSEPCIEHGCDKK